MRSFLKKETTRLVSEMKPEPRKAAPIIHKKKLFGGMSAEEFHSRNAFPPGSFCAGCKRETGLTTRAIVMIPLDEARKRDGELDAIFKMAEVQAKAGDTRALEAIRGKLVDTIHGKYIKISTTYSCNACRPALEKALAHAPSWAIVDINRGPGVDKIVSGFGGK